MKDIEQQTHITPTPQRIEAEYINSMFNVECLNAEALMPEITESEPEENKKIPAEELSEGTIEDKTSVEVDEEIVDFSEALIKTKIECTVFNIKNLQIAVPTSSIYKILNQQALLNTTDNSYGNRVIGQFEQCNRIVNIVDISYVAMNKHSEKKPVHNIVLLKGCAVGFVYDQLNDTQLVVNEEVRWRDMQSQRLWLAGTVAQKSLCLLDIDGLVQLIQDAE